MSVRYRSKAHLIVIATVVHITLGSLLLLSNLCASAQTRFMETKATGDQRGEPELVICTQNLKNYSIADAAMTGQSERKRDQHRALIARFVRAKCDVIAVQEVIGRYQKNAERVLQALGRALANRTNRSDIYLTGESNDKFLKLGFLIAADRASVIATASYADVVLPKFSSDEKPRNFSRGPLEVTLDVKGRGNSSSRKVVLVNMHFKSRRGGSRDAGKLEFEIVRMQEAETLRRVLESRHPTAFEHESEVVVVLGDRNSHFDTASAKILNGSVPLKYFLGSGTCRLSKRGVPLCKPNAMEPAKLFSVLTNDKDLRGLPGTYVKKNIASWIDDILISQPALSLAWETVGSEGDYDSGLVTEYRDASDHALAYVVLNWG